MAYKDKLFKTKRQKMDPLEVIQDTFNDVVFCEWLVKNLSELRVSRIFSLKRIAKMFLADNPGVYSEYEMNKELEKEDLRIAKVNVWEDD